DAAVSPRLFDSGLFANIPDLANQFLVLSAGLSPYYRNAQDRNRLAWASALVKCEDVSIDAALDRHPKNRMRNPLRASWGDQREQPSDSCECSHHCSLPGSYIKHLKPHPIRNLFKGPANIHRTHLI